MKDRTKILAKDLVECMGLASVYRHKANQKGYISLNNRIEDPMEHWVVVETTHGRRPEYPKEHVDHINMIKNDNRVENLRILDSGT